MTRKVQPGWLASEPFHGVVLYGLSALAGLALGAVSAWAAVQTLANWDRGGTGAWRVYTASAESERNPYSLAALSLRALLPMRAEEARYFVRGVDETGDALREGCSYVLVGGPQPARWWSLTLYSDAGGFARNEDGAHSLDATVIGQAGGGAFIAEISSAPLQAQHWMSNRGAGEFFLMLRLYGPSARLPLAPSIRRTGCNGGTP